MASKKKKNSPSTLSSLSLSLPETKTQQLEPVGTLASAASLRPRRRQARLGAREPARRAARPGPRPDPPPRGCRAAPPGADRRPGGAGVLQDGRGRGPDAGAGAPWPALRRQPELQLVAEVAPSAAKEEGGSNWRRRRRRRRQQQQRWQRGRPRLLSSLPPLSSLRGPEGLLRPRHRRPDLRLGPCSPLGAPRIALRGARGLATAPRGGAAPERRGGRLPSRPRQLRPLPRAEVPLPLAARSRAGSRARARRPGGPENALVRLPQPATGLAGALGAGLGSAAAAGQEAAGQGEEGGLWGHRAAFGCPCLFFFFFCCCCCCCWCFCCCFCCCWCSRSSRGERTRRRTRREPPGCLRHLRCRASLHALRRAPLPPRALLLLPRLDLRRGPGPRVLVRGEGRGHGKAAVIEEEDWRRIGGGGGGGGQTNGENLQHETKQTLYLSPPRGKKTVKNKKKPKLQSDCSLRTLRIDTARNKNNEIKKKKRGQQQNFYFLLATSTTAECGATS